MLLRRGEPVTAEAQRAQCACCGDRLAALLALEGNAYNPGGVYPLGALCTQTKGIIGYMIEQ